MTSLRLLVLRGLTFATGCLGLGWCILALPQAETSTHFEYLERRLLRFETFSQASLTRTLKDPASQDVSPCDTHAQRALLLIEMQLTDAALTFGSVSEFDSLTRSLETRTRQILSCTPRESFTWLIAFDLELIHGRLNDHAFDLLEMSYRTSPNEAWISIRRAAVAVPVLLNAPAPIRQKILSEFQQLIRYGFEEPAARIYLHASGPTRALLQAEVEQMDAGSQKAFSNFLPRRAL
jgi:hypothetical protein